MTAKRSERVQAGQRKGAAAKRKVERVSKALGQNGRQRAPQGPETEIREQLARLAGDLSILHTQVVTLGTDTLAGLNAQTERLRCLTERVYKLEQAATPVEPDDTYEGARVKEQLALCQRVMRPYAWLAMNKRNDGETLSKPLAALAGVFGEIFGAEESDIEEPKDD